MNPKKLIWISLWLVIISLSLYFYVTTLYLYSIGDLPTNFKFGFWESKIWFIGHITGASASLLLGPMQFWKDFRNRYLKYHRLAGKTFIIGSLIAAVCAFRLNLMYECKPCRYSLGLLSIVWLFATAAAWWAVKHKNIKTHRQMMVRSYTAALAFVFIRVFSSLGYQSVFPIVDTATEGRITGEWFCWVIPFMVIEFYMVWWPSLKTGKTSKA